MPRPQIAPTAPAPQPGQPGYAVQGGASEASLDQVNTWMRSTPWYQEMLTSWGQDPGHPKLNPQQRRAITKAAQAQGVVVDQGNIEIDEGGNFDTRGHALRNTLIVMGIAGATIATMGAAGVFAGAAGASTPALASTAAPMMGVGTVAGGTGIAATTAAAAPALTGAILPAAATAAGVLPATAAPLMGATVPTVTGLGTTAATTAAAAAPAAASVLPSTTTVPTATGTIAGGTGLPAGAATTTSLLDKAKTAQGWADRVQDIGEVVNGINQGRQHGREVEGNATMQWDRNANQHYQNSMDAAKLNLQAPQTRAQTSVRGDILANAQPFSWTGETKNVNGIPVPQYSGGLSPSLYSSNTRQLGGLMSEQALQQQQTNNGRAVEPQAPQTPLPRANAGDNILSTAGTIASLYGAYRAGRKK